MQKKQLQLLFLKISLIIKWHSAARYHINNKELYKMHADFCKFMDNAKRIEMLFLLGEEELCVEEPAHKMDVPVPNISQHLAIMRDKGIVDSRRAGTKIYYRLSNPKTLRACILMREAMIERMEQCVAKAIDLGVSNGTEGIS